MRIVLFVLLVLVGYAAFAQEVKTQETVPQAAIRCETRITYSHYVYGLRCPWGEVVQGIVQFNPYVVECGKIETFCSGRP